jgi:hypothetical protein
MERIMMESKKLEIIKEENAKREHEKHQESEKKAKEMEELEKLQELQQATTQDSTQEEETAETDKVKYFRDSCPTTTGRIKKEVLPQCSATLKHPLGKQRQRKDRFGKS